jgi:hypothetical protein
MSGLELLAILATGFIIFFVVATLRFRQKHREKERRN